MDTVVRRNERSWAIELITQINQLAKKNDLAIKRAGGESTVSTGKGNNMFPDVILYGNQEQSVILQGWELKMPDVPIENEEFILDAQRKARALNLNSCMVWNFTYAALYVRGSGKEFKRIKFWNDTSYIKTREDVQTYRKDWERLLEKIILDINQYFLSGEFRSSTVGEVISNTSITTLIQRNKTITADCLREYAKHNAVEGAYISNWWENVKAEYEQDETDSYEAYAKSVILNWSNRIVFAHIIKDRQKSARIIDNLTFESSPQDANCLFEQITQKCDFYNVFTPLKFNDILPELTWKDFIEFSTFLKNNGVCSLSQAALQNILEGSVHTAKREINGQYTTPPVLARILVRLTIRDWGGNFLDCCCGTGTIPKEALKIKKQMFTPQEAVASVWACDKYRYPLQVANISMTDTESINLANRLFQHNALTLTAGENIDITNPSTGKKETLKVPLFDAISSNLPFVPFEIIPEDDKAQINQIPALSELDDRSDLYCSIAVKIGDMLKPGGMLGIITSNSWLGTKTGHLFVEALQQKYYFSQVHVSGKGRWFHNADVVTTIMILQKKDHQKEVKEERPVRFYLWKKSLDQLSQNPEFEETLVNSSLLGKELDPEIVKVSGYSPSQIQELLDFNISYNALFHKVEWLPEYNNKIIRIDQVFRVFRGSRRGWDPLFYPKAGTHHIEPQYLKHVLINAREIDHLDAKAEAEAFCCNRTIEELQQLGHKGAVEWIQRFSCQNNGVGKPLPQVLSRKNMLWYELKENEVAEIFTMMNPDQRLFFARFEKPSFVNQRLIGLCHRSDFNDQSLNHALLNSIFTMFCIEAAGFGRGLGVLDINKDSISRCYMLNPQLVSSADRPIILNAFEKLKKRSILRVIDELNDPVRLEFEHCVMHAFNMEKYFSQIRQSLLSMQATRATAREK